MAISTLNTVKTLRIAPDSYASEQGEADILRAVPHIRYLQEFDSIEWSPEVLGLDEIGHGRRSTLVGVSPAAVQWLKKLSLLKQSNWNLSLGGSSRDLLWSRFVEPPRGVTIAQEFIDNGGFVNLWEDEQTTHFVWGWLDLSNPSSILAFSWLQHVLAGGRMWQRRELRMLSDAFTDALPIGYLNIDPKQNIRVKTFGVHQPIFEKPRGEISGLRGWLHAPRKVSAMNSLPCNECARFHLPVDNFAKGYQKQGSAIGVSMIRCNKSSKRVVSLYPSGFGSRIDSYQKDWTQWLYAEIPDIDSQIATELLLCVREAVINADKHGCKGAMGKRVGLVISHDRTRRMVKVEVSDPGVGHKYNINAPVSRQDHEMGKHLGLMLIHGLASSVRLFDKGSTIEFDFTY